MERAENTIHMTHHTHVLHRIRPDLWQVRGETNGYLIVRGDAALLIDCPLTDLKVMLTDAGLPIPEVILHTHVQEEHCREWSGLSTANVYLPAGYEEVAGRTDAYFTACDTIWPPSREWDSRGEERYGIGGCPTERPPTQPLHIAGLLHPGTDFVWRDITLEVLPLPGHGKFAVGFYWREANLLFSGDLLRAGGYLVNFYDLERSYGILTGHDDLRVALETVRTLAPAQLLPATGPLVDDPATSCKLLRTRLDHLDNLPIYRAEEKGATTNFTPRRTFGRYRESAPGIYQNTNFGNIVLFVDADGNGCMIDPDFCVWESWEENCRQWHADLDLLEQETGLRRIELALITHYHGDHVQYCDLLRERYGTTIATAPDVAAVMEEPRKFRYPCGIDWYGFPFDHVKVDRRLAYEETFYWHDVPITPIHVPGHCFAAAGYIIPWQGMITVSTGDVLQYGSGPVRASFPVFYNDTAWPDYSALVAFRRIAAARPDLVLGGHCHAFREDGTIMATLIRSMEEAIPIARDLAAAGDLLRASNPPGYDEKRPATRVEQCKV